LVSSHLAAVSRTLASRQRVVCIEIFKEWFLHRVTTMGVLVIIYSDFHILVVSYCKNNIIQLLKTWENAERFKEENKNDTLYPFRYTLIFQYQSFQYFL
jgi:flagellar biogenesis protein FliO